MLREDVEQLKVSYAKWYTQLSKQFDNFLKN